MKLDEFASIAERHPFPWRTGTKPGVHNRTLYDGSPPNEENERGGELVGMMLDGDVAAYVAAAVNWFSKFARGGRIPVRISQPGAPFGASGALLDALLQAGLVPAGATRVVVELSRDAFPVVHVQAPADDSLLAVLAAHAQCATVIRGKP